MNTDIGIVEKEARWWDITAAILLSIALLVSAGRLVVTGWTEELSVVLYLVLAGSILGFLIGISTFSPFISTILSTAYGFITIAWITGIKLEENITWSARIPILNDRVKEVIISLIDNQPVRDPILFIVLMGILYWILSVHAGYTLTRYGNAWSALIPSGLVLFSIHSFDGFIMNRTWFIAVFIFFSLVLVARLAYIHHQERWIRQKMYLPANLGINFVRYALILGAVIVLFSWSLPALAGSLPSLADAAQPVKVAWSSIKDSADYMFASLRSSVGLGQDSYDRSINLGYGNPLTDDIIFTAENLDNPPGDRRVYWRAQVYDTYSKGRWVSTLARTEIYTPSMQIEPPIKEPNHQIELFQITPQSVFTTLYLPTQPTWISNPGFVETIQYPDGEIEYTRFRADPAVKSGQNYIVQASIANPTVDELRAAGTEYPQSIRERYLQLPTTITSRTLQLAREITKGLDIPYDKTEAITNFLRTNIKYQDSVPTIPQDHEPIDWFLFEYRKGFCNYYSTAEIILLRAAGVPARWAVGYAQGELLEDGTYRVRQFDAHSWPEVYFPGIGWVEFEPTVSQRALVRQYQESDYLTNFTDQIDASMLRRELEKLEVLQNERERLLSQDNHSLNILRNILLILLATLVTLFALGSLLLIRYHNQIQWDLLPIYIERIFQRVGLRPPRHLVQWVVQAQLPTLNRYYMEINYALNRLGVPASTNLTPAERAEILGHYEPKMKTYANILVEEYQIGYFSTKNADLDRAKEAAKKIKSRTIQKYLYGHIGRRASR